MATTTQAETLYAAPLPRAIPVMLLYMLGRTFMVAGLMAGRVKG